jgi:hypothetical protein
MKHEEIIKELQDIAAQLGVTVRYERGDFEGGYCVLKDQKVLLINKRLAPVRKAAILSTGLHEIGMDNIFLRPSLRAYVEDEVARAQRTATSPS